MKYNNHLNYRDRKRFLFKLRLILFTVFILLASLGAYIYFSVIIQEGENTAESTTSQETSGYFAPSVKIFRSPFFQFQTDQHWVEVPTESTSSKYVYRSLRNNLIEHDLVVYVNQIPANLAATRVVPANTKANSELLPIGVSDHCGKLVTGADRIAKPQVLLERVKIKCDADSPSYSVFVGLVDGSTALTLPRPDSTTATYTLLYTNLKALPDASQLLQISSSFQTR